MRPFRGKITSALLMLAVLEACATPGREEARPDPCDGIRLDERIDPLFRRRVARLTPEDRDWAQWAIGQATRQDPFHFLPTAPYDTVVANAGRAGLEALLAVVLYRDGLQDDAFDFLTLGHAGTVLRARPAGAALADSGLMVLARRVRKHGLFDDRSIMIGLMALTNPGPLPTFGGPPRMRLPGTLAALCTLAHAEATEDLAYLRRIIVAWSLLVPEWEDRFWATDQSLQFLRSLSDTNDARSIDSSLAIYRAAYRDFEAQAARQNRVRPSPGATVSAGTQWVEGLLRL